MAGAPAWLDGMPLALACLGAALVASGLGLAAFAAKLHQRALGRVRDAHPATWTDLVEGEQVTPGLFPLWRWFATKAPSSLDDGELNGTIGTFHRAFFWSAITLGAGVVILNVLPWMS